MQPPPVEPVVIVHTAVETGDQADRLARALVEQRLAACVQQVPSRSTYHWDGAVQQAAELLLLIKTSADRVPAVLAFLHAHHPYTLPELLVTPVSDASPDYARWVHTETRSGRA